MCTVFAIESSHPDLQKIEAAFSKTASRGPDDTRYLQLDHALLGFQRLSIMGPDSSGMQPFSLNGNSAICNGEIYGFRKLKDELIEKGYTFSSESDCEILLPLYEQYGTDCFGLLDAEYACVIYDAKTGKLIAARDPIGIRPLHYGYTPDGEIVFCFRGQKPGGSGGRDLPLPTRTFL